MMNLGRGKDKPVLKGRSRDGIGNWHLARRGGGGWSKKMSRTMGTGEGLKYRMMVALGVSS